MLRKVQLMFVFFGLATVSLANDVVEVGEPIVEPSIVFDEGSPSSPASGKIVGTGELANIPGGANSLSVFLKYREKGTNQWTLVGCNVNGTSWSGSIVDMNVAGKTIEIYAEASYLNPGLKSVNTLPFVELSVKP